MNSEMCVGEVRHIIGWSWPLPFFLFEWSLDACEIISCWKKRIFTGNFGIFASISIVYRQGVDKYKPYSCRLGCAIIYWQDWEEPFRLVGCSVLNLIFKEGWRRCQAGLTIELRILILILFLHRLQGTSGHGNVSRLSVRPSITSWVWWVKVIADLTTRCKLMVYLREDPKP